MKKSHIIHLILILLVGSFGIQAMEGDPFMGDWKGILAPEGKEIVAQVIAYADGHYQTNLLPAFDQRCEPIAVLEGVTSGNQIIFTGENGKGQIKGDQFTGEIKGSNSGTFEMTHVTRLSPSLGAKPPKGAIVLFDGSSLEGWETASLSPWFPQSG